MQASHRQILAACAERYAVADALQSAMSDYDRHLERQGGCDENGPDEGEEQEEPEAAVRPLGSSRRLSERYRLDKIELEGMDEDEF